MGRPVGPAGSSIAIDAQLDDATAKVQSELDRCDRKLELLKNHMAHPPASSKTSAQRDVAAKPADVGEPTAVRRVITATGQGCKDVLAAGTSAPPPRGALWKTRAHKTARTESSCMLQLREGRYRDVTLRITFSEAATVPARLCLEHAPTPTAAFAPLGVVPLQAKSMKQLKHVFRLGPDTIVQKCLRISCLGHIAKDHSCVHSVSYLLITGEPAPVIEHKMAPSSVVSTASAAGAPAEMETASSGPPRILVQVPDVGGQLKEAASLPASRPGSAKGKKGERIQLKKAAPPPPPLPGAAKKAAPPPPPPLAGMGKPAAKAAAAAPGGPAPSRPTLRLFWDKLQPRASTLNGTVWGQLANGQASLDFAELEEEFAAKQPAVDLTVSR